FLRILLQKARQLFIDDAGDDAFDLGTVQTNLRLRVELGLGHLDADDGRDPFAKILADRFQAVLEMTALAAVGVQGAREGGAETGEVSAAALVVRIVGIAAHALFFAIGVLKRY